MVGPRLFEISKWLELHGTAERVTYLTYQPTEVVFSSLNLSWVSYLSIVLLLCIVMPGKVVMFASSQQRPHLLKRALFHPRQRGEKLFQGWGVIFYESHHWLNLLSRFLHHLQRFCCTNSCKYGEFMLKKCTQTMQKWYVWRIYKPRLMFDGIVRLWILCSQFFHYHHTTWIVDRTVY